MITTDQPEKQFQLKWKAIAICMIMVCASVLGTAYAMGGGSGGNSIPVVIESGSGVETASYIIYQDGDYTCLKNGTTGRIEARNLNFTTVLQSAADLGGTIAIVEGEYELDSKVTIGSNFKLVGSGDVVINYVLDSGVAFDTPEQFGTPTALTANASIGAISLTVANGSLFQAGDYIKIVSNRTIGGTYKRGEMNQILNVDGNVLTLTRSVDDTYAVADPTAVAKITFNEDISFENIRLNGSGVSKLTFFLKANCTSNLRISNCELINWGYAAVHLINSRNTWIEGCVFENNFYSGLGYSVSISDTSENTIINNNVFRYYGRHYIATGGILVTGSMPGGMYRNLDIIGNTFESSQYTINNEAINNHEPSYGQMTIVGNSFKYCGKGVDLCNSYATISNNYFFDTPYGVDTQMGNETRSVIISNNQFKSPSSTQRGIYIDNGVQNVVIEGNTFQNSKLVVGNWVNNTMINGNQFIDVATDNAVEVSGASNKLDYNISIINNQFKNCGSTNSYYAVKVQYAQQLSMSNNMLSGSARFYASYSNQIQIDGNNMMNSVGYGIEVISGQNVSITNNVVHALGSRAISITTAGYANTAAFITGNTIVRSGTSIYSDGTYTNLRVKNNAGWLTEKSGVATILNGQSYVIVTHGLSATPTKVIVTSGTGGTYTLYVTNLASTTFRIYADSAVSGNQTVYWYAEV